MGEVGAGGQGVGVRWAEDPQLVGEQIGGGGPACPSKKTDQAASGTPARAPR